MKKISTYSERHRSQVVRHTLRHARAVWGPLPPRVTTQLKDLAVRNGISVAAGDILQLSGNLYVTHAALLRLAARRHCVGIRVRPVRQFCDPSINRWVFEAVVYKTRRCKGFVGFGDASPSTISTEFHGCEMRIAETRAVSRALRKAYGVALCSVEELGWPTAAGRKPCQTTPLGRGGSTGSNTRTVVRDRLCRVIRTYHLDPEPVKRYAADFCGVANLREANREMVEDFVNHIEERAAHGRDALIAQLRSYASEKERKHEAD